MNELFNIFSTCILMTWHFFQHDLLKSVSPHHVMTPQHVDTSELISVLIQEVLLVLQMRTLMFVYLLQHWWNVRAPPNGMKWIVNMNEYDWCGLKVSEKCIDEQNQNRLDPLSICSILTVWMLAWAVVQWLLHLSFSLSSRKWNASILNFFYWAKALYVKYKYEVSLTGFVCI